MSETQEQIEYEDLCRDYQAWRKWPYPSGWGGVNVAGVELVLFDADTAILLGDSIERRAMSPGARGKLEQTIETFAQIRPHLSGEAVEYFEALRDMTARALRLLPVR